MKLALSKPQFFLFAAGAIALLVGLLFARGAMDIHLHDTYFVISSEFYYFALAVVAGLIGTLYILCRPALRTKILTWLHVGLTVTCITALIIMTFFAPETPQRKADEVLWTSFPISQVYNNWLVITVMILIFSQVLFLINLGIGIARINSRIKKR